MSLMNDSQSSRSSPVVPSTPLESPRSFWSSDDTLMNEQVYHSFDSYEDGAWLSSCSSPGLDASYYDHASAHGDVFGLAPDSHSDEDGDLISPTASAFSDLEGTLIGDAEDRDDLRMDKKALKGHVYEHGEDEEEETDENRAPASIHPHPHPHPEEADLELRAIPTEPLGPSLRVRTEPFPLPAALHDPHTTIQSFPSELFIPHPLRPIHPLPAKPLPYDTLLSPSRGQSQAEGIHPGLLTRTNSEGSVDPRDTLPSGDPYDLTTKLTRVKRGGRRAHPLARRPAALAHQASNDELEGGEGLEVAGGKVKRSMPAPSQAPRLPGPTAILEPQAGAETMSSSKARIQSLASTRPSIGPTASTSASAPSTSLYKPFTASSSALGGLGPVRTAAGPSTSASTMTRRYAPYPYTARLPLSVPWSSPAIHGTAGARLGGNGKSGLAVVGPPLLIHTSLPTTVRGTNQASSSKNGAPVANMNMYGRVPRVWPSPSPQAPPYPTPNTMAAPTPNRSSPPIPSTHTGESQTFEYTPTPSPSTPPVPLSSTSAIPEPNPLPLPVPVRDVELQHPRPTYALDNIINFQPEGDGEKEGVLRRVDEEEQMLFDEYLIM